MTASQIIELGRDVGSMTGQYGAAQEAVEALAASGKLSGDEIRSALRGLVEGAQVTGQSVEKLVEQFEKIAEDPAEGIYKLNERYNFLTADIYKQIIALQKQGKTHEAVQLAFETYTKAMDERLPRILENTGAIEQAWMSVKTVLTEVKNAIMDIGRSSAMEKQLAEANAALDAMYANYGAYSDEQRKAAEERIETLKRQQQEEGAAAKATGERIRKETDAVNKLHETYKKKDTKKTNPEQSAYDSLTASIKQQIAAYELQISTGDAVTEAEKLRIKLDNEAAGSKKKLTEAHKAEAKALIDRLEVVELEARQRQFAKEYERSYEANKRSLINQYDLEIQKIGLSTREAEKLTAANQIMFEAEEKIREGREKKTLAPGMDETIIENARKIVDLQNQLLDAKYDAYNDPWLALTESLKTYKDEAEDAGTQIRDLARNAFSSMEDAFVKFATTGKISFSDLVNSILADIARMYAKKATASLFDALFALGGEQISSGLRSIFGSSSGSSGILAGFRASGGPVSGKSAYIVGEKGPELFVPNTSGQILPNGSFGGTSGINVQISHKNEGTPQQVTDTSADFDGRNLIIKIVTQDIQNDGMISRTMSRTFGVRRAAGAM